MIPTADRERVENEMAELGARLGRAVDVTTVVIDPSVAGPWATIAAALGRTRATDLIVPNLAHVEGIETLIRERAQLITLTGERILQRIHLRAGASE
ncbi:hypothetical protein [Nocardia macrotermitis]|uniref:hypothetical protein n=1 Tax=Nocardia macrotermitis TaxID=2585198 RepID=UPI001297E665|nr:hypothetical protein [Nocardia macrotermitis]